jgi:myo-inositol-1(or 4)-monophosphatase
MDINLATKIARRSAEKAAEVQRRKSLDGFSVATKANPQDLVTDADHAAERAAVSVIREAFPKHDIIGEEEEYQTLGSDYVWHIDPIDGTTNFARRLPFFSVSVCLAERGEPLVAVVIDTSRNEHFWATRGGGAFSNSLTRETPEEAKAGSEPSLSEATTKISVSSVESLGSAMLATGFLYERGPKLAENLATIERFFEKGILGLRRFGSAALELAYVAAGRFEGFWEQELSSWDFAAGALLVQEAGGRVTDEQGASRTLERGAVVASNRHIHSEMLAVIE